LFPGSFAEADIENDMVPEAMGRERYGTRGTGAEALGENDMVPEAMGLRRGVA
jgi:hypothetical protein